MRTINEIAKEIQRYKTEDIISDTHFLVQYMYNLANEIKMVHAKEVGRYREALHASNKVLSEVVSSFNPSSVARVAIKQKSMNDEVLSQK